MSEPVAYRSVERFTLGDMESVWNILRGGSVIDWQRLYFETDDEIAEFLRVQGFDPDDAEDMARVASIQHESIEYLRRTFEYPIPRGVAELDIFGLLKLASTRGHRQVCACVILKAMHTIHHLQGRELLYMVPMSDAQVFGLVEAKIFGVMGEMMSLRLPIAEFMGGRKSRDSLYTKLLSKSENIAAQVYDKLRFRVVTQTPDDTLAVLNYLSRRLFPFNFVIPGESKNTLVDPVALRARYANVDTLLGHPLAHPNKVGATADVVDNKFSARSYRVIHFVVDIPVRIPDEAIARAPEAARSLGKVVFVLVEFQLVDKVAAEANEQGEASHAEYKERQRNAVRERLSLGGTMTGRRGQ